LNYSDKMGRNLKILITIFLSSATGMFAQQRPVQSLYMFDPILINPAYAGNAVQLSATFLNRSQWVNIPGAPTTQTLSVHSGFFKSKVGVGLIFSRDVIGIHSDYGVYGVYSFNIHLPNKATLALGLQAGFNQLKSDFTQLNIRNLNDPNLTGVLSKFNPNFGTGVYYYTKSFYAGISVPYLLENKLTNVEAVLSEAKQSRMYYMHAGFQKKIAENIKIAPNLLIRVQEGAPLGIDLNANIIYKQLLAIGASYRSGDAIIFLFQLKLIDNLYMGYAYDYITSELNKFSNGSHEIMLNYRVKISKLHKGIECPAYF
jgi:type IX secretion system PorP/SprF family membrane protein